MKTLNLVDRAVRGGWGMAAVPLALALLLASYPAHAQRMPQDSWYLAKEMKRFVEPGKFYHPHDAALGPDGNLYVADRYNHRVQVFDQDGNFIRQFGNYGSGNGEFNEVSGIHVTPDGKVYVCEWRNNRVQVFTAQGKFIRSMGQPGSGEGQLSGPHGVTVDNDGNVYVVEHNNARVSVFKPDGTYLRQWGSSGTADGQFQGVIAICRTPDNKIAVLERDGERRVQVFDKEGNYVRKFSGDWISVFYWDGKNFVPYGIETDASGNFYVSGRDWKGIHVFNSSGSFVKAVGDSQFNPFGLAVGNGKVFACDWDNHRIAIFSTNGTWIKNFGTHQNGDVDTHGIAVDANGNIFISYHQANVIYKFSPELAFIKSFGSAGSGDGQFNGVLEMAIGPNQRLYVVDHSGHRVQYFDLEGNFLGKFGGLGSGNGNLRFPWGIAVGKDNKVYVADRDNHRIQVFDANGTYLTKFGTQGKFDAQFQSPNGVAVLSDGRIMVNDRGNRRLQVFDAQGNVLKVTTPGWSPDRIFASTDGQMYGALPNGLALYDTFAMAPIKEWGTTANGPIAETKSGDLICAHHDRVVRVWKRTFRTVHPETANALPLPTIVSQKRRPGTALVDVDYTVKDADNATVQTAALAFKNGENSLSDVIPITSFADGTGNKLGANIATGQTHRFTWDVARDWSTDFGEVQLEILAKDGRGLLNLDFIQIPATGNQTALKISRSPLKDNDFLSVWYWLIATGDMGVRNVKGVIRSAEELASVNNGLVATYYENDSFTGSRVTKPSAWPSGATSPLGEGPGRFRIYHGSPTQDIPLPVRSIVLTGDFLPAKSGTYKFYVDVSGGSKIMVGGTAAQLQWDSNGSYFDIQAIAGTTVPFVASMWAMSWSVYLGIDFRVVIPPGEAARPPIETDFRAVPCFAFGIQTTDAGRAYIFQKMGLREATAAEVTRAKEAGTPGVINQWDPKLRVGPDERPAKINAYGFDTGADGYWVVPVSGN